MMKTPPMSTLQINNPYLRRRRGGATPRTSARSMTTSIPVQEELIPSRMTPATFGIPHRNQFVMCIAVVAGFIGFGSLMLGDYGVIPGLVTGISICGILYFTSRRVKLVVHTNGIEYQAPLQKAVFAPWDDMERITSRGIGIFSSKGIELSTMHKETALGFKVSENKEWIELCQFEFYWSQCAKKKGRVETAIALVAPESTLERLEITRPSK